MALTIKDIMTQTKEQGSLSDLVKGIKRKDGFQFNSTEKALLQSLLESEREKLMDWEIKRNNTIEGLLLKLDDYEG